MHNINFPEDEYQLGPFKIKTKENILASGDNVVVLLPKVMTLLVYLCRHAQQVVTFDNINEAIWPKEVVGDNAIYNLVGQLRKALGDNASKPTYIQTISKVGYRLLLNAEPILPATTDRQIAPSPSPKVPEEVKGESKKNKAILALTLFTVLICVTTTIVSSKKRYQAPNDHAARQMQLVHYQLYRGDSEGIDQAIESLQQLIATEPRWMIPKLELAYSFIRKARHSSPEKVFWLDKADAIATENNVGIKGRRLAEIIKVERRLSFDAKDLFDSEDVMISARLAYSDVLFTQGKTAEALAQTQLAIAQCANCPYVYHKLATSHMILGNVNEGFNSFSRYRMLVNHTSHNPANNAGLVPLNKKSLTDMANWLFQTPLPTNLLNHQSNALALFYLSLGQVADAESIVMSSSINSSQFYDLYTQAAIAGAKGDFQTSYMLLVKRQQAYPDNDRFKLSVVYALWQTGRFNDAMKAFERFVILPTSQPFPDHMPFDKWSLYAALLLETGNQQKADAILAKLNQQLTTGYVVGSQNADIRLALVLALQGKTEESMTQLLMAISQGWVNDFNQNWWYLKDSPYFRSVISNKEFQRILADYQRGIANLYANAKQH